VITIFPRYYNPSLSVVLGGQPVLFTDGKGLQVRFRVERTLTQAADKCEVEIYGLDPIRARLMLTPYETLGTDRLTVRAGYDGILAGLFTGDVRTTDGPRRAGRDDVLKITADDGGEAIAETPIRISNAGMTALQMIQVAALAMQLIVHPSVPAVLGAAAASKQGPYTAVMTGKAADLLDAACRRVRARWRVQDGQIMLSALGVADLSRPAVLLTDQTLVSPPAAGGQPGEHKFITFMDPNILPGSQVSYRGGLYRAEHVIHAGETRSSVWTTEAIGTALAA